MKNRKKMYIIIGVVVAVALATAGIVYAVLQGRDNEPDNTSDTAQIVDPNRHIGVIGVVSREDVNAAFEGLAKDATEPEQSGTLIGEPTLEGESVHYNLTTDKNGYTVQVQVNALAFSSKSELEKATPFAGASEEVIDDLGDEARYFTPRRTDAEQQVAVIVVKDATSYKFSLVQNRNDGMDITETAAKQALLALARDAKLVINKD